MNPDCKCRPPVMDAEDALRADIRKVLAEIDAAMERALRQGEKAQREGRLKAADEWFDIRHGESVARALVARLVEGK